MAKASKKMVVYLEIEDEVTQVIRKLERKKGKKIYLVVPKGSIFFQSVVNLEIVKKKFAEEKEILMITNDPRGIHLAKKAEIEVFEKMEGEGSSVFFRSLKDDGHVEFSPLRSHSHLKSADLDSPTRRKEKKVAISEVLDHTHTLIKNGKAKAKKEKKIKRKVNVEVGNKKALASLVAVSLVILVFILYIALPGATITLVPTASQLEKSLNITLADFERNSGELATKPKNTIASYPIGVDIEKVVTHKATGKRVSGDFSSSSGLINIINTESTDWPLVDQTRFQTAEGLVFRIQSPLTVPGANAEGPGTIKALVVADEVDSNGQLIGERGNIGPSQFIVPGLSESSQSKLYAESEEEFTGGVSDFVTFISEEDVSAAKTRLGAQLQELGTVQLKEAVQEEGKKIDRAGDLMLLEGKLDNKSVIEFGEPSIEIAEGLVGQELEEFELTGKILVQGRYFDNSEVLEILEAELVGKKSPNKQLLEVSSQSITYRIFEHDKVKEKYKVTANIKGIEQFDIDPDSESGKNLLEKIRDHIAGKRIEEAELFIQNLPEINKATIESWPAWSPTIPKIQDNIEFEIRDAIEISD